MKNNQINIGNISPRKYSSLDSWGINEIDVNKAIGEIFNNRVDYADLYFQYNFSEGWSLEEGIVKKGNFSINQGVGIRSITDYKTAFAYSDTISKESILSSARFVRSISDQNYDKKFKSIFPKKSNIGKIYPSVNPLSTLSTKNKIKLIKDIEKMAKLKDNRIKQVMVNISSEFDIIMIINSKGYLNSDIRPLIQLSITVIAEYGNKKEYGHSGGGARLGFEYFSSYILKKYVDCAVNEAIINLDARPAPAGNMPVILGPGWPGILIHEAIGHGLEGDFIRKGSSIYNGKIGEKIASKSVTIVDNGTLPNRRGSLNIDDEGNKTKFNILVEKGILKKYIQDITNSKFMNTETTGNGRRESFSHLPMPRMTNTYMINGDKEPEEIISSVKDGIYAVNFGGGQVDITGGNFVFSASESYKIENGKITYPIKGATIIGNGLEVMNQISLIGNDMSLDFGIGSCGKEGQSVPVGVGIPTLKIDCLNVGGTNIKNY